MQQDAHGIPAAPTSEGLLLARGHRHRWLYAIWKFTNRKPLGALGAGVLLALVLAAIFAPFLARYDAYAHDVPQRLIAPGADYWFGTDIFGRDIYSRVIFGARISLYVGLLSVTLGTLVGTALGVVSGYNGGWFDLLTQRVVDTLMGFPSLILALVLVVALEPSLNSVVFAIAIGLTPRVTRLARGSSLATKGEAYILAAQAIGGNSLRVMLRHIVPNSLAPVFVLSTGYLGTAIIVEASLSFLGLGVPPPFPSWGNMLQFGARGFAEAAPWMAIFPGLALTTVTFGFALFGDALRDVLDPRLRGS